MAQVTVHSSSFTRTWTVRLLEPTGCEMLTRLDVPLPEPRAFHVPSSEHGPGPAVAATTIVHKASILLLILQKPPRLLHILCSRIFQEFFYFGYPLTYRQAQPLKSRAWVMIPSTLPADVTPTT